MPQNAAPQAGQPGGANCNHSLFGTLVQAIPDIVGSCTRPAVVPSVPNGDYTQATARGQLVEHYQSPWGAEFTDGASTWGFDEPQYNWPKKGPNGTAVRRNTEHFPWESSTQAAPPAVPQATPPASPPQSQPSPPQTPAPSAARAIIFVNGLDSGDGYGNFQPLLNQLGNRLSYYYS